MFVSAHCSVTETFQQWFDFNQYWIQHCHSQCMYILIIQHTLTHGYSLLEYTVRTLEIHIWLWLLHLLVYYTIYAHTHIQPHTYPLPDNRHPIHTRKHTHTHPNTDIQNTTIYTSTPAPWCGVNTILIRYICEFVRVVQVDIFLFIWYTCSLLVILSTHTQQEDSGWHLEYFGCTDPQHTWHFLTQKFVSIKKDIHNFFYCSCFFDH